MSCCHLKCFGVGDGWPSGERGHSAFLYRFGDVQLLFDCGEPVSGSFKASGANYDAIDRIFLSHLNFDHIGGLFMLLQGFWLEGRTKDLTIHLPAEGIVPIRQLLDAGYLFEELLPFRLSFDALHKGEAVSIGGVRVTPFANTHLDSLRVKFQAKHPQAFEAFSFLIEHDGVRVGHSADIGAPEDLVPLLKKPLDLLVSELAHFEAEKLFDYLRGQAIKRIIFVHLSRKYWDNFDTTRRLAEVRVGGIPHSFAHAGEEILFG
ncbi:MAG: ribonuclease Z [Verrucomicrobia bacterium]|nr:ribonuclease Z [Verrucomicrobiota bacterium]